MTYHGMLIIIKPYKPASYSAVVLQIPSVRAGNIEQHTPAVRTSRCDFIDICPKIFPVQLDHRPLHLWSNLVGGLSWILLHKITHDRLIVETRTNACETKQWYKVNTVQVRLVGQPEPSCRGWNHTLARFQRYVRSEVWTDLGETAMCTGVWDANVYAWLAETVWRL